MATTIHIDGFAERLKQLCVDYYETMMDDPPIVTNTMDEFSDRGDKKSNHGRTDRHIRSLRCKHQLPRYRG